jgi:Uri superfamily endonuclease
VVTAPNLLFVAAAIGRYAYESSFKTVSRMFAMGRNHNVVGAAFPSCNSRCDRPLNIDKPRVQRSRNWHLLRLSDRRHFCGLHGVDLGDASRSKINAGGYAYAGCLISTLVDAGGNILRAALY